MKLFRKDQGKISLALTDLVMPRMSGADLIKAKKATDPDTKIIAWTGDPLDREERP